VECWKDEKGTEMILPPNYTKDPMKPSLCKNLKLDSCLSPCKNINSKWIKDLDIRPEILKLVQEGAGNTLEVVVIGKDFLNRTPAV
jgi:hypothetical protein